MHAKILLIGSGGYGALVASALENMPIPLEIKDGKDGPIDWQKSDATHVIIATPNYTHYDLVMEALKAGKHVLCEKPLALTLAEVKKLHHLAYAYKRYLGVGFVLNNHPFYAFVKAGQSQYGPIRHMRIYNHATEGLLKPEWYWKKTQSGGWFMVAEIHWYHLFAWLTGAKDLNVLSASEEKHKNRTIATTSRVATPDKQELLVEHRLDMTYETAWTKVEIVFDSATIVINDWVPRSGVFPVDDTQVLLSPYFLHDGTMLWDKRERGAIYRDLIRENIYRLLTEHPADRSHEIILAHEAAIRAQKLSQETGYN